MEKGVIRMESGNLAMRHLEGNFHLDIDGIFTSDTARQVSLLLATQYTGSGNIFIHTEKLVEVEADVAQVFCKCLADVGIPLERVYGLGQKDLKLSNDTQNKVVSAKKTQGHHSCGRCKNCKCGQKSH
jgi:hypothetical protein